MPDQMLTCKQCGAQFPFTERDQEFYSKMVDDRTGKTWEPPKSCRPCRQKRKAQARGR